MYSMSFKKQNIYIFIFSDFSEKKCIKIKPTDTLSSSFEHLSIEKALYYSWELGQRDKVKLTVKYTSFKAVSEYSTLLKTVKTKELWQAQMQSFNETRIKCIKVAD